MTDLLLVFDFETTGLTLHPDANLSMQPRMIEFGGALLSLDDGSVVDEMSKLVHPRGNVGEEITKITGITNEMLVHEGNFEERLPEISRFFARATSMCSHNLPFDRAILRGELARMRVADFPWPKKEFCTIGLYREKYGFNPNLQRLYEDVMGKPLEQTHRALDDVHAVVEIVQTEELWRFMK